MVRAMGRKKGTQISIWRKLESSMERTRLGHERRPGGKGHVHRDQESSLWEWQTTNTECPAQSEAAKKISLKLASLLLFIWLDSTISTNHWFCLHALQASHLPECEKVGERRCFGSHIFMPWKEHYRIGSLNSCLLSDSRTLQVNIALWTYWRVLLVWELPAWTVNSATI